MSTPTAFAALLPGNPFHKVFQDGLAPIQSVVPRNGVILEGDDERCCYFLDWRRCSGQEKIRIGEITSLLTGTSINGFLEYMNAGGEMPIRASQVKGTCFGIWEKKEVA
jgi:hypothetical protein